jgi:hypothetical protein
MARPSKFGVASTVLGLIHFAATIFIVIVVPLKLRVAASGSTTKCLLDQSKTTWMGSGVSFCNVLVWFVVAVCAIYSLVSIATGCLPVSPLIATSIMLFTDAVLACSWFVMFVLIVQRSNAATAAGIGAKQFRSLVALAAALASVAMALDAAILVYSIAAEKRQKRRFESAPDVI